MAARRKSSTNAPAEPAATDELGFEAALERLESLVDRLEQGELELEEALTVFEQGVGLMRHCAGRLEQAERRIEVLTREGDEWIARPFAAAAESEETE